MQTFDLAHLGFRLLAVIPEISHMGAEFLLLHLYLLGVDVEDIASAARSVTPHSSVAR